jgi:hypothetical protein
MFQTIRYLKQSVQIDQAAQKKPTMPQSPLTFPKLSRSVGIWQHVQHIDLTLFTTLRVNLGKYAQT